MTSIRPHALSDALDQRRSRRDALRLLAGGALGGALALGGARPDAVEAAVAALPALPKGWTHLAGTTTGLLFYRRGAPGATAGSGACGTFVDGRFARKATSGNFAPNWSHVIGATRSLLFYRASDGLSTTAYLDAAGTWIFPPNTTARDIAGRTPFPGTRSGRYLWYNSAGDPPYFYSQALTADGTRENFVERVAYLGGGWTHGAGAGFNTVLLYRGGSGKARTGRILTRRDAFGTTETYWEDGTTYDFVTGWTHIVGTFNGGLLFYNRQTGAGASGYLDAYGNFTENQSEHDFKVGWTHVVGAGARGVLYYNAGTGKGVGGFLNAAGVWTKTTTYGV